FGRAPTMQSMRTGASARSKPPLWIDIGDSIDPLTELLVRLADQTFRPTSLICFANHPRSEMQISVRRRDSPDNCRERSRLRFNVKLLLKPICGLNRFRGKTKNFKTRSS